MGNHSFRVRAASFGALLLLVLPACHDSDRRAPGAGAGGGDLVNFTKPGLYGIREIEVVGPASGEGTHGIAEMLEPVTGPRGMMPPALGAELRIEGGLVTWLDGLDVAAMMRGEHGHEVVMRNAATGDAVDFSLDHRGATGNRHVELALTRTATDLLVGTLRYTAADASGVHGGSYRIELARVGSGD